MKSTEQTKEIAIAGRSHGLCEKGDKITWRATHFGITQTLEVEITRLEFPTYFEDRMLKGAFKSMQHQHYFEIKNGKTLMRDIFEYTVPYGFFGWIFNHLILKRYMRKFLENRNRIIKKMAENGISILN